MYSMTVEFTCANDLWAVVLAEATRAALREQVAASDGEVQNEMSVRMFKDGDAPVLWDSDWMEPD